MTKKRTDSGAPDQDRIDELKSYVASLRRHKRVIEGADRAAAALPTGVTHIMVTEEDGTVNLVEKRKSFF